ncbi:uncharacterized protein LOC143449633 isoform X2 [Clavelina lepadiformis]|uniref:uncharacterized protein LOC143449633 isoform X2 n=1 Tax=Clavelina lepadiformis TaxID=159417 RepID=UPI0040435F9A
MLLLRCATTAFVFAFVSAILCSTINAYDYGENALKTDVKGKSETKWTCDDQHNTISSKYLCDNQIDCLDGSDESDRNCGERECEFKCTSSSHCVYDYQLCDGTNDCLDGSDEDYCYDDCPEFACVDDPLRCLDKADVCDNYKDCNDGSDELNCSQVGEFQTTTVSTTTTTLETTTVSKKMLRKCRKNPSKSGCGIFWRLLSEELPKNMVRRCVKKPNKKKCRKYKSVLQIHLSAFPSDYMPSSCKKKPDLKKCIPFLAHIAGQLPKKFIRKCHKKPDTKKCIRFQAVLEIRNNEV